MSAQHRARRSTSKAALDTDRDSAQSNGATLSLTGDRPDPSSTSSPSRLAAPANFPATESGKTSKNTTPMLSALPASSLMTSDPPTIDQSKGGFDDHADNRSSSLSELDDASDDQSEPTPRPTTAADLNDNDSEAETERLETTPRKLKRTATDTSFASEQMYTRTPSKLAHSKTVDQDDSAPPTPSLVVDEVAVDAAVDGESALHSLSLIAASEAASLEYAGKKRKRSSAESSTVDEQTDEPARKRSSNVKGSSLNGRNVVDSSEQIDAEEELDNAEERISQLAQEEIDLEERQADIAAEAVSELATVARSLKPRKGGRRGKRKVEDTNHASETPVAPESHDAEGDGENDEEDSATLDEEVAKKRNAIDELAKIEKKFKIFREKLCDEQIAQYEQELEMLKQPNCVHPEYLAMIKCIDERRAEKIAYEKQLLRYKEKNLEIITKAERHQLHSQYFQTVRDVREDILAECNQQLYELQRGRRQLGSDEVEYMVKLPEKRSDQIRHQTAYNLEVSILSGVAKYVGFPAAPEIRPARPAEIEDDLRAMKISTRPAAPPPSYVRPFNRTTTTTTADEAAAEEQFLERTPWANPQHPAHQQTHYGAHAGSSRVPSYQTPAGQRRVVDINASNGSASTIEAHSNPPSSTAYNANGRIGESESPVLQMKRHPGDHSSYLETPGSIPRPIAGLSKESYAGSPQISSSPVAHHVEATSDDHGGVRWGGGGARPLNTIAPGTTSGPVPGRQDGRVPVAQRSGFGTVDLGNGKGLFGR